MPFNSAPLQTRWASRLQAIFYHLNYFAKIRAIKKDFNPGRILVKQAKDALKLNNQLVRPLQTNEQYNDLADMVQK